MMSLKEIQKVELDILVGLIHFLDRYDIKYSLGGGSLIGVIRHNGFVPWDDDIDVFMVRSEYDRFIEAAKHNNYEISEYYVLMTPESKKGYYYTFPKVVDKRTVVDESPKAAIPDMGLWVDIFPIDYCSNTEKEANDYVIEQMRLMLKYYKFLLKYDNNSLGGIARNIYLGVYKIIHRRIPVIIRQRCDQLAHNEKMKYSGTLRWCFNQNDAYPSEWFDEYIYRTFENQKVMVFKEYDKILTHRFGNYMEIPNEAERGSHSVVAEWR